MNYIGSKFKLLPFLQQNIESTLKKHNAKSLQDSIFCDLFAGTGAVSKAFKLKVKQVISNDKEYYSFVLNQNYIANYTPIIRADELLKTLNNTPLKKGKIFTHYALGSGSGRQYFSDENAMKIDGIREKITQWQDENFITQSEFYFLLASLLESSDRVANTACVYGAFLKCLKKSATKELVLSPAVFESSHNSHKVFNEDSQNLITQISGDILYLDPPYNAREYGANYHLLNTIALYDDFIPKGKTGLRAYEKSAWCKKSEVEQMLDFLLQKAQFKWIFLSYNDEGLLSLEKIEKLMKKYGTYACVKQDYQRFKADSMRQQKQSKTTEYLHILHKA
ncbi:restriction endonuclease subunit M [Helicobacter cinaedi]|uniref:DNA adenine methylase n=1 Tax=Helicobacter cinaedi TaxID=213 RepID=UPI001EED8C33|nr:DNA adenine methylase [Helicobacter cinaedi]BDB65908.1 restriction endonuclease subunit M [Helicobacter cinaedi]